MSENPKLPTAQNTIQDPPEYNADNAKNPKGGSDWLGGPQNGNETPSGSDYTKHRFDETRSTSTEGAYQTAAHSTGYTDQLGSSDWLGGPQNGREIPGNGGNGGNGGNALVDDLDGTSSNDEARGTGRKGGLG